MDIVGTYGYAGQQLWYIDAEKFCYVSGNGIVIVDVSGPKDIIWRDVNGISAITTHVLQKWLAIAPKTSGLSIEILDGVMQKTLFSLKTPSNVSVVDMAFSKDGARLAALTDITDRRLVLYGVSAREILHSYALEDSVTRMQFNPGNANLLVLSNAENMFVGVYSESMAVTELKLTRLELLPDHDAAETSTSVDESSSHLISRSRFDAEPISYSNPIAFACWSSLETLIVGSHEGFYFEVNYVKRAIVLIGNGHSSRGDAHPTSAVLTADYLIVGAADGTVKWFLKKLVSAILYYAPSPRPIDAAHFRPVKVVRLLRSQTALSSLCCMVINPMYSSLVMGSLDGTIHIVDIDLEENANKPEEEGIDDDPVAALINSLPPVPLTSSCEPFMDMQVGVVLCAKSLYIQVMQTQDGVPINEYSGSLSLLLTGGHTGDVMFWRTPVPTEADVPFTSTGIRKSLPRMPRVMTRMSVQSEGAGVCQLEILSTVCKHGGRILAVGTSDGWLELWLVEAFESEEEDGEGDEEEGLFYLKVTKMTRRHMFHSPLTIISTCETRPLVAVASSASHTVYVLALYPSHELVGIASTFSLVTEENASTVGFPKCCTWQKNNLWMVTEGGVFICIADMSEKSSAKGLVGGNSLSYMGTSINHVGLGLMSPTGILLIPELISDTVIVTATCPTASTNTYVAGADDFFPTKIRHSARVMCIARCLTGHLVATGCNDGTVFIWKASIQPGKVELEEMNRYRPHFSAVLALEFSVDSSLLMSCAVDGSVIVINVEKLKVLKKDPRPFSIKVNEEAVKEFISAEEEMPVSLVLWSDLHQEQIEAGLRDKHASSLRVVADSVASLRMKLERMLQRNQDCDELERMDNEEFVVDMAGKAALNLASEREAADVRMRYESECLRNELLAARVRAACWDMHEVFARCLLPIQESQTGLDVWSFPIKKYSTDDLLKLERIKRLRALEMRAQISHGGGLIQLVPSGCTRSAWITAVEGSPVGVTWLVNDGARWPCADVESMLIAKDSLEQEKRSVVKETGVVVGVAGEEDDEVSGAENDVTEHDVDFSNVLNLLYPPQAVRTQVQKRAQIALLKDVCRQIRFFFNEKFEAMCRERADVTSAVEAINLRIHEILTELQLSEEVFEPKLSNVEIPMSAIVVEEDELVSRPYVSEASILKRQLEEEDRKKKERENAKDDSKGRALVDMMNGTLEVKRDVFAEASAMHKPEWMETLPYDSMTEAQKKEADEYEDTYKQLQEEQSKYKKILEIELKRLRSDVKDLCKDFDEKVVKLAASRIITEREILSHELYMSRIALGMATRDQLLKSLLHVEKSIVTAETALKERQDSVQQFSETVQAAKETMLRVSEEEKNMVKTFPRDIRVKCDFQFDQETLKTLTHFFKYRGNEDDESGGETENGTQQSNTFGMSTSKKSASTRGSKSHYRSSSKKKIKTSHHKSKSSMGKSKQGKSQQGKSALASQSGAGPGRLGPMQEAALAMAAAKEDLPATTIKDPFYTIILKQERETRHMQQNQPSSEPLDIPEDLQIDQYFWSKLNELRTAHIQKQIEANTTAQTHAGLKKRLDELLRDETGLKENVRMLHVSRDEVIRSISVADKDLQCVVAIRQGQDEVDKDVIVTDYSDSALIPTAVINKYNARIKELGQDKIEVLTKIKQFRRKINLLNWEAVHAEIIAKHLEEYLTDLQLFRVTRNMQQLIREGDESAVTEDRTEKIVKKDGAAAITLSRADKFLKSKLTLKRLLRARIEENHELEHRITELHAQIEERKGVLISRREARGEDAEPSMTAMKRMKKVVNRRRLVDMATMQAAQISHLRKELENMRDRTFPSFVKAFRSRLLSSSAADDLL